METAPVLSMAAQNWPKLRELWLYGRYLTVDQAEALPRLLSTLEELRKSLVQVARHEGRP